MDQLQQAASPEIAENMSQGERSSSGRRRHHHHSHRSRRPSYTGRIILAVGILYVLINAVGIWWLLSPLHSMSPWHWHATLKFFLAPVPVISLWSVIIGISFYKRIPWALRAMTYTAAGILVYLGIVFRNLPLMKQPVITLLVANLVLLCIVIDRRVIAGFERQDEKQRHSRHRSSIKQDALLALLRAAEGEMPGLKPPTSGSMEEMQHWVELTVKTSGLPYGKTLAEFDFSFQPRLDRAQVQALFELAFLNRHENLFFVGSPGVGKTHLAVALAIQACQAGHTIAFITLADLIRKLKADQALSEPKHSARYLKSALVVVDEVGYSPVTREESLLFYRFVAMRYEKASTVFTSNTALGDWADIFQDSAIATAIIDRLLHHSQIINISGNSYRLKDK